MLRVVTSMIRNAPGPLKGVRSMTADLLDGLIDKVSPPVEVEQPPPMDFPQEEKPEVEEVVETKSESVEEKPAKESSSDFDKAFDRAMENSSWVRKQDFKVLAIFWKAKRKGMGPMTAKAATQVGSEINLNIRHENIRKVIRTRLEEKIDTTTVPESQPPTFQYELSTAGLEYFESEYLKKA